MLPTKYAQALLDLMPGAAEPALDAVLEELRRFVELYESSAELRTALSSPAVPVATRQKVVSALVERMQLSDLARRFLLVVCEHGRMPLIADMQASFEEQMDARLGRVIADVGVAAAPSDPQKESIRERLAAVTGKQVRARFQVQDELLGGFRAQIGSKVYDASVKGQFDALRHQLGEIR
ncbi:MAG: ATP synthase F1 subunit delta [Bryobacterales bacterium]|nr:ATP synthase F1 subunit delta [Bryobacterales bacterium]